MLLGSQITFVQTKSDPTGIGSALVITGELKLALLSEALREKIKFTYRDLDELRFENSFLKKESILEKLTREPPTQWHFRDAVLKLCEQAYEASIMHATSPFPVKRRHLFNISRKASSSRVRMLKNLTLTILLTLVLE